MARIGITGHRHIPGIALPEIRHRLEVELKDRADVALSSLAAGADQLFADRALAVGIPLTAVVPAQDYVDHLDDSHAVTEYRRLLGLCRSVVQMPYDVCSPEAYEAAGRWIVEHCDRLLAVWDGEPARGRGGTAEIVAYAHQLDVPVQVLWLDGALRA
ncbi:hypothetical protein [Streptomyces sp. VRA16 Mangrove soil]|uniref:hypothetical protein n=1 Tax=Streptomyces sp. VRA16 Mangrove soil TaxID=2817434 RepID=UPI001A9DCA5F|nr:hypothetical protein [Streptomyces sp. VRA16 Mangrove soil]MBO1335098.1 hypothetical protein [Streptomyces sp. VRA16 Mangrove soil]